MPGAVRRLVLLLGLALVVWLALGRSGRAWRCRAGAGPAGPGAPGHRARCRGGPCAPSAQARLPADSSAPPHVRSFARLGSLAAVRLRANHCEAVSAGTLPAAPRPPSPLRFPGPPPAAVSTLAHPSARTSWSRGEARVARPAQRVGQAAARAPRRWCLAFTTPGSRQGRARAAGRATPRPCPVVAARLSVPQPRAPSMQQWSPLRPERS